MKTHYMFQMAATILALVALTGTASIAAQFYVIQDGAGNLIVVDQKPLPGAAIVEGPFPTRAQAEVVITGPAVGAVVPAPVPRPPVTPGTPPPPPPLPRP